MKRTIFAVVVVAALGSSNRVGAQIEAFQLGGGGEAWADWTEISVVADAESAPGSIQPLELQPDVNILSVIGPWGRWKNPRATWWRPGLPRIWRGRYDGAVDLAIDWDPLILLDGDPSTSFAVANANMAYYNVYEFYTFDFGAQLPVERWRFFADPEGTDAKSGEPFFPSYAQLHFEVTGGRDATDLAELLSEPRLTGYAPLEIPLVRVENNFEFYSDVTFPLQYLRVMRYRPLPEDLTRDCRIGSVGYRGGCDRVTRYGIAEFELYGRGVVPNARWESVAIDMGKTVNVGPVHFGISYWRRDGEELVEAPEAKVAARIELKTGLDDTPTAFYTWDQMGRPVETTEDTYASKLKDRLYSFNPQGVGWRGPITADTESWSPWSAPLERSGDQPRLPKGRYVKVQLRLETETLLDLARVDSVVVTTGPLLAERVRAEVAVAGDLQPVGNVAQVPAGEPTELVYDLMAEFTDAEQPGFDAVRLLTPSKARFLELEMGDPLAPVEPDSVVVEEQGFALFLPRPIIADGDLRLRLRLETSVYDAAGEMAAEAFLREGEALPQGVDPGDVSDELGTNQLRVLAVSTTLGDVIGDLAVQPPAVTPQGDGVNEIVQVNYSLFSVRETHVEIGVYGLDGRQVRQLYVGPQSAGAHAHTWDGRDDQLKLVPPGIYLMRVEVDADEDQVARPSGGRIFGSYLCISVFLLGQKGRHGRRLIRLIFAGWLPPVLGSSRSYLGIGSRVSPKGRLVVSSRILLTSPFCPGPVT